MTKIRILATSLLMLTVAGCATFGSRSESSTFFVRGADAMQAACGEVGYRELALACHRIGRGEHLLVGMREYSNLGRDKESFKKLTLVLESDVRAGDVIDISAGTVKVFYSTGLSFRPGYGGCYGAFKSGVVSILAMDAEVLKVRISGVVDRKSPAKLRDACPSQDFDSTLVARSTSFERLGPWEGVKRVGQSLGEESVPSLSKRGQRK